MNPIILNSILFVVSLIITISYTKLIRHRFGMQSSISASAKLIKSEGKSPLFYLFITGLVVPMTYLSSNYFTIIAGMLLFGIGMITGYNPDLKKNKTQDDVHVFLTDGSILLFVIGIIVMSPWYSIIVVAFGIPAIMLWIKKVECHTWKIEVLVMWIVYLSIGIEKIALPLIKLLN